MNFGVASRLIKFRWPKYVSPMPYAASILWMLHTAINMNDLFAIQQYAFRFWSRMAHAYGPKVMAPRLWSFDDTTLFGGRPTMWGSLQTMWKGYTFIDICISILYFSILLGTSLLFSSLPSHTTWSTQHWRIPKGCFVHHLWRQWLKSDGSDSKAVSRIDDSPTMTSRQTASHKMVSCSDPIWYIPNRSNYAIAPMTGPIRNPKSCTSAKGKGNNHNVKLLNKWRA